MTDEERQQAEAYIKLHDNVNELIDERVTVLLMSFIKNVLFKDTVLDIVIDNLKEDPRSFIGMAITNHVRLLNREHIK